VQAAGLKESAESLVLSRGRAGGLRAAAGVSCLRRATADAITQSYERSLAFSANLARRTLASNTSGTAQRWTVRRVCTRDTVISVATT
jgi:hypothetical protein